MTPGELSANVLGEVAEDHPNVLHDLPATDYHALPGISSSMIRKLARAPEYLLEEPASSPAIVAGSIMHALVIEQREDFLVFDGPPSERTKATKAFREAAAKVDLPLLLPGEAKMYRQSAKEVRQRLEGALKGQYRTEVSLVSHEAGKRVLRARLDMLEVQTGEIVDFKFTTRNIHEWHWVFKDKRYDLQVAHYVDLATRLGLSGLRPRFVFIVVNIGPPLLMRKISISAAAIAGYRNEWLQRVEEMRARAEARDWTSAVSEEVWEA